jgi:ATP-dependent DNA ligase
MLDGVLSTYFVELLEFDGEDLRGRPLTARKEVLARLLRGVPAGIILNAHYEKPTARSRTPCALGCRGIVSKRLGSP